jgi:hypothetical protein
LFSQDDEDAIFLDDKPLVVTLATQKLEAIAEQTRAAEGWKWAEVYLSEQESRTGYSRLATFEREQTPRRARRTCCACGLFGRERGGL